MASVVYQPTASQWASAAMHLDRRSEWRTVRIDGTRYVSLLSGRSNHVYLARADAAGCSCPWYANTFGQCSHMLAVELAAMEDELSEQPAPKLTAEALWGTTCRAGGCTDDAALDEKDCPRHVLLEVF